MNREQLEADMNAYLVSAQLTGGYYNRTIDSWHSLECGPGWYPLLQEVFTKLIEMGWDKNFLQIKEKFGGLRFYANSTTDEMEYLISQYEDRSEHTCEVCSQPGSQNDEGWISTLCPSCREANNK
jgi:rubrerythrin